MTMSTSCTTGDTPTVVTRVSGEIYIVGIPGVASVKLDEAATDVIDEQNSYLITLNLLGKDIQVRVLKEQPNYGVVLPSIDLHKEITTERDRIVKTY